MRYLVREKLFSIGDDFWIEDEEGRRAFYVDGKVLRIRETLAIQDPQGRELAVIHKKLLSVRDAMTVERDGETLVTVRKKLFTPFRDVYRAELASGDEMEIHGDFLDKEYDIEYDGRRIARICNTTRKASQTCRQERKKHDCRNPDGSAKMLPGHS